MTALEKSQELFKELESLRPLTQEDEQRIMQKFRLDWNYHSNHLEGNQLTFGETKALILFNVTAQGKPLKDHIEMTGHNEAIGWIIDVIKENRPLTENFIRHLHELLLKEPYEVDAQTPDGKPSKKLIEVGKYKETPNHVRTQTGEIFYFATPEETPAKMYDLLLWFRAEQEKKDKHAILLAAEFHYRFIRIHPFDDGNGRLARIIMNFILMSHHYPPVVIKTEDKENYFSVLRLADAGQLEPFINYITENLNYSLELMIKGAKGESIEEDDDLKKEITLLESRLNSLEKIKKSKDSITHFLNNNAIKIYQSFYEKAVLFDKFYFNRNLNLAVDRKPSIYPNKLPEITLNLLPEINDHTHSFTIFCNHNNFKTHQLKDLEFYCEINLEFEDIGVKCYSDHSPINSGNRTSIVMSKYDSLLSNEDIGNLINGLFESHKSMIEQKLNSL